MTEHEVQIHDTRNEKGQTQRQSPGHGSRSRWQEDLVRLLALATLPVPSWTHSTRPLLVLGYMPCLKSVDGRVGL